MTVEFDNDAPVRRPSFSPGSSSGGLAGWLTGKGFAKSKRGAEAILAIIAIILIAASIFFWKRSSGITQAPGASFYVRSTQNR